MVKLMEHFVHPFILMRMNVNLQWTSSSQSYFQFRKRLEGSHDRTTDRDLNVEIFTSVNYRSSTRAKVYEHNM